MIRRILSGLLLIGAGFSAGVRLGPDLQPPQPAAAIASDVIAEVRANTELVLDRIGQVERNTAVLRGVRP